MYRKILIQCKLVVVTGMHIGGSSTFSAIGAVDSPVVRDALSGLPIVPGSSLKGKLRTLIARSICGNIEKMPDYNEDDIKVRRLFGSSEKPIIASRLQFSDCFMTEESKKQMECVGITEVKFENGIDRRTSVANPRQIERVNPGACFGVNIVYDVRNENEISEDMELLAKGFKLLQLDYLGGHGSRGSGRVSFRDFLCIDAETGKRVEDLENHFIKVQEYELFAV